MTKFPHFNFEKFAQERGASPYIKSLLALECIKHIAPSSGHAAIIEFFRGIDLWSAFAVAHSTKRLDEISKTIRQSQGGFYLEQGIAYVLNQGPLPRSLWSLTQLVPKDEREKEIHFQRDMARCLLLRRSPIVCPSHMSAAIVGLAQERDLSLMPILADALEEADLLDMASHCRKSVHSRHCWVLDSILGVCP